MIGAVLFLIKIAVILFLLRVLGGLIGKAISSWKNLQ